MKTLIILTLAAGLAACAQPADPAADNAMANMTDNAVATDSVLADTAPDGGPVAGAYAMRDVDGNIRATTTLMDDGTYTYAEGDDPVQNGTYEMTDTSMCFDSAGDDVAPVCYPRDDKLNDDKSWNSYDDAGTVTGTIIRIES